MKPWTFLYTWKNHKDAFIKPKLKWYFGSWRKEGNMPAWRNNPIIRLCKYGDYEANWDFAKLVDCKWTVTGKKSHPILSRIFKKPLIVLPYWLNFHFFNEDVDYKTKWAEADFRYENPPHITLVFFGLALSVTAYIPKGTDDDWTCEDDYWESLLTYDYYDGDLKKTNDEMGWWNKITDKNFRFRFQPRFLVNPEEREELIKIQMDTLRLLKQLESEGD